MAVNYFGKLPYNVQRALVLAVDPDVTNGEMEYVLSTCSARQLTGVSESRIITSIRLAIRECRLMGGTTEIVIDPENVGDQ